MTIDCTVSESHNIDFTTQGRVWWEEIARIEDAAGLAVTLNSIPPRKHLTFIFYGRKPSGGSSALTLVINGDDSGSNWTTRVSTNGAADATATNNNVATILSNDSNSRFYGEYVVRNLPSENKVFIGTTESDVPGGANETLRQERILKWGSNSQINTLTLICGGAMSNVTMIVLGHD